MSTNRAAGSSRLVTSGARKRSSRLAFEDACTRDGKRLRGSDSQEGKFIIENTRQATVRITTFNRSQQLKVDRLVNLAAARLPEEGYFVPINEAREILILNKRGDAYAVPERYEETQWERYTSGKGTFTEMDLKRFLEGQLAQIEGVRDPEVGLLSLLIGKESPGGAETRAPQVTHTDTGRLEDGRVQMIGTWVISEPSNQTIVYDMAGVPIQPTADDLGALGIPGDVVEVIMDCGYAANGHLQLLYADESRRPVTSPARQFQLTVFPGDTPHCAPGGTGHRAVFFFGFKTRNFAFGNKDLYDGNTQMSREKLWSNIYHDGLDANILTARGVAFVIGKLADALDESASYGAADGAFLVYLEEFRGHALRRWRGTIEKVMECAKQRYKENSKGSEEALEVLKRRLVAVCVNKFCGGTSLMIKE